MDEVTKTIQVAVFPLPGMVAFEGQQHLLHVFEPRYRKMIEDCMELRRPLGLSLAGKKISSVDNSGKSFQEILNSNQNTYEAHDIFGAGSVRVLRTLPDGRILVMIHIQHRVRMENLVQTLPYFLAEAEIIDVRSHNNNKDLQFYFESLLALSRQVLADKYRHFEEKLPERIINDRDLDALLLKIMDWFRLDPLMLQELLELDTTALRASRFVEFMKIYLEQQGDFSSPELVPDREATTEDSKHGKVIRIDFQHRSDDESDS